MQVSTAGMTAHETSKTCFQVTAARRQHAVATERKANLRHAFSTYDKLLKRVQQFKYFEGIVSYDNNGIPAVHHNIKKSW